MALATYTDLQSAAADWLNRSDLSSVIPTFISLAEAKFNREMRTRDMLTRAQASTSNEFVSMPADFLEMYDLELNMSGLAAQQPLSYIGPNEAKSLKANKITNLPRYFTIIDGAFEILPAPTGDINLLMTYYAKIPALSSTQTTNWLLTKSPDLYLYSTLLEAAPYLKDDARVQLWAAARQQVMDAMALESERASRQTIQLTARRRGFGL
jgi:hypothetical protein